MGRFAKDYKFMTQDGEYVQCESCDYPAPLASFGSTSFSRIAGNPMLLCRLCAATHAGNAVQYPSQYLESASVLKAISYVGNTLLDQIGHAFSDAETVHIDNGGE